MEISLLPTHLEQGVRKRKERKECHVAQPEGVIGSQLSVMCMCAGRQEHVGCWGKQGSLSEFVPSAHMY